MVTEGDDALAGRYVIGRELGRGGMATVYLAHDRTLDRDVAIKILHAEISTVLGGGRFAREIQIASRLQHPGIVALLDSGEEKGRPFFTMPVVDGETLAHRLAREHQLRVEEAVGIAIEIAEALQYAHAQGVLHRDIKPANILLSNGRVLITDFGVARAVDTSSHDRLTESGVTVGTAHYMSPEQASADTVDERSDVYALGCVLYEMLAGTPPFTGSTTQSVLARHAVDTVPSVRTVRTTVTRRLESVIEKSLAKVPADRYASAAEFRAALEEALRSTDVTPVPLPGRRRGLVVGMIAAIAAAAAASSLSRSSGVLDDRRIVGFPLKAAVSIGGMGDPSEDVAALITAALDNRGSLRVIEGWRLLDAEDRASNGETTPATMRALAKKQRARYYITGTITPVRDSVTFQLDLVDLRDDSTYKESAAGTAADLWKIAITSVNKLLPRVVGGASPGFEAAWIGRAPGAVASFLAGESALRKAQYSAAFDHFRAAVTADSQFAIAAIRGAQAATASHQPRQASSLVAVALRDTSLSEKHQHFARGYDAYLRGDADSAIAEFTRAFGTDSLMSAAWAQMGETYTHLIPAVSNADSLADEAFSVARRLDSSATGLLLHPIEIRLRRNDVSGAAPLITRFLAAKPDADVVVEVETMHACVKDGPGAVNWQGAVHRNGLSVLGAGLQLATRGAHLPCAAAAYGAVIEHDTATGNTTASNNRASALVGLVGVLIAQGRLDEAATRIAASVTRGDGGASLLMLATPLVRPLGRQIVAQSAEVAGRDSARFGADYARCSTTERCWILSLYHTSLGNRIPVESISAALHRRTTLDSSQAVQSLVRATAAHVLLVRKDTVGALEALGQLLASPLPAGSLSWDPGGALGPERLLYAQLLRSAGQLQKAIAVADAFDSGASASHALYLRASLELRADGAAKLGNARAASAYRSRLLKLVAKPAA